VQHSGTANMGAEVRIQNRLIDPQPDYLLRRQYQTFQWGIRHIVRFAYTCTSLTAQQEEPRNEIEVASTDPLVLKL
jgi:hypothetical protein